MTTAAELRRHTVKQLAAMAKRKRVVGWHAMRKEELVKALVKLAKSEKSKSAGQNGRGRAAKASAKRPPARGDASSRSGGHKCGGNRSGAHSSLTNKSAKPAAKTARKSATKPSAGSAGKSSTNLSARATPAAAAQAARPASGRKGGQKGGHNVGQKGRGSPAATGRHELKDLAGLPGKQINNYTKDRLVVMVRDPYWLHAYWELTRRSVERARVALGPNWHAAKPILRLAEVSRDATTSTVRQVIRDIEIHGGVNNWYVDVSDPPRSFQLDIGYLAPEGRFLCLARSNVVTTPQVGAVQAVDGNWAPVAEDFDRIYALSGGYNSDDDNGDLKQLFEERLHRPMGSPMMTRFGLGASSPGTPPKELPFHVGAELIIYGATDPSAHVTLRGEPVQVRSDGTFQVRFNLPERRQVLPVVASSHDGVQQRTIVLAVERNTKVMETVIREPDA
ncbi:MAG TPA: DUF4912 domain-containing protein [Planctomycetaceae bacterium]|nr:DUF4912 domain-containing protein [Planctomycetaceae bacterium]